MMGIEPDNSSRLRSLIESAGITQREAAEIISRQSGDRVSLRAVQAWLAPPDKPSARPCPASSIKWLEMGLKKIRKT